MMTDRETPCLADGRVNREGGRAERLEVKHET